MTVIIIKKINDECNLNKINNIYIKRALSKYINKRLNQSIAAWILLDEILKEYFDTSFEDHKVLKTPSGKPYFEDNSLYFSLSHTNNVVMCGVSNNEIGVDIEQYREISSPTLNKYHINNSLDFIKYHTKKEARCKKLGISIFNKEELDLSDIETKEIFINQLQFIYSIDIIDKNIKLITKI